MKNKKSQLINRQGFTLIELLVVISIIAILSTIGLTIYSSAQKQARMSKRISDLKAIQSALQVYYSANKTYPVVTPLTDTGWRSECVAGGSLPADQVIPLGFVPNYMAAFPADPQMDKAGTSCYLYRSNGVNYRLIDWNVPDSEITLTDLRNQPMLWDPSDDNYEPASSRCASNWSSRKLAVYSLGGRCLW